MNTDAKNTEAKNTGGNVDGTGKRLLWFAGLWLAGVAGVAALAYAIRAVFSL